MFAMQINSTSLRHCPLLRRSPTHSTRAKHKASLVAQRTLEEQLQLCPFQAQLKFSVDPSTQARRGEAPILSTRLCQVSFEALWSFYGLRGRNSCYDSCLAFASYAFEPLIRRELPRSTELRNDLCMEGRCIEA